MPSPQATHTSLAGLDRATDSAVWLYAQEQDYVIVTKDVDFSDVSVLRGFPPKVIWIRLGNCTTSDIENALRRPRPCGNQRLHDGPDCWGP